MDPARNIYVCPETRGKLTAVPGVVAGGEIVKGRLINERGTEYAISAGIPDLTFPRVLEGEQKATLNYYDEVAQVYDDVAHLSFRIQYVDEMEARQSFTALLNLRPGYRVLEIGCGTGRDSRFIASGLDESSQFYLMDLSRAMLTKCRSTLERTMVPLEFAVGNACFLPFPDSYFDAVFSFGGLGTFGDIRRSLAEMVRVSRVGAKVVVGDESMPPWLRDTELGRILISNNPLFSKPIPLGEMPVEARDVHVRWVIGGVYYLVDFAVGEGEPTADYDLEIPGARGGTLRTRYYGGLEGVRPETKLIARRAADDTRKSMHRWVDEVVREAAERALGGGRTGDEQEGRGEK